MFDIQRPVTELDNAYRELEAIDGFSDAAFRNFKEQTNFSYDLFWEGRTSPTLKAQAAGTNLLAMFVNSAKAQAFIKSIEPDYEERGIPEGWEVKWGNDGSGTITKKLPE